MSRSRPIRRCWKPSSRMRSRQPCSRQNSLGGGHAIGVLHVRHAGQLPGQFASLVVGAAPPPAVTPTDHAYGDAPLGEPAGEPLDHRRLAGAAERKVAHAMTGTPTRYTAASPAVVAAVSPADDPGIRNLGRAEAAAQHGRPRPATPAADQVSKAGSVPQHNSPPSTRPHPTLSRRERDSVTRAILLHCPGGLAPARRRASA